MKKNNLILEYITAEELDKLLADRVLRLSEKKKAPKVNTDKKKK